MEPDPEPYKRYICSFSGCAAAYNKQWKLDAHLCKHTGVRPHTCEHPGCGKAFSRPYHLARHELSHSGVKPYVCSVDGCTEAFTTNANRARHVNRVHVHEPKKYVCKSEGCGLEFRKNQQLKAHMCEQHTRLPPYPCTHEGCPMRFTVPSKLKRHEKVHRGYPCKEEGCIFTGKTWTEYLKHRQEQHRVFYKCDQCNKVCKDSWFLQQHQQVHSESRRVFRCPRDGCGRSFTTTYNLQSHIRSFHEELRPFICSHEGCGRTFVMKQGLQRHTATHDPDRKKPRRPRPKRSLASRLSGYGDTKAAMNKKKRESPQKAELPGPVELVCLLQDTSLVHSPTVDVHEHMTHALNSPLTV